MPKQRLRERLFDEFYYVSRVRNVLGASLHGTREDLVEHYRTIGWRAKISPTPYFDIGWYLATHPGFAESGQEPIEHYIESDSDMCSPHPLFDVGWYRKRYLANNEDRRFPVLHYIEQGWAERARPNPLLWTDWYMTTHGIDMDPFYHFVASWRSLRFDPNPLFDTGFYCSGLSLPADPDPLSHYIHVGSRKSLAPHPLIDPAYYAETVNPDGRPLEGNLLAHYFAQKSISPCPLFDTATYLEEIGDRMVHDVPLVDYVENGSRRGLRPHGFFSPQFYLSARSDRAETKVEPLRHYFELGWRDGTPPHPLFDAQFYTKAHPEVSGNPLVHYLTRGWHQGHAPRPSEPVRPEVSRLVGKTILDIGPFLDPRAAVSSPPAAAGDGSPPRLGIFVHVFYPDVFRELVSYLNNVGVPCTVFMTTCDPVAASSISALAAAELRHPFRLELVENCGRDIAPFLVHQREALLEVDLGLHIHTKKSLHYRTEFTSWRRQLLDHLLGSPALVQEILALLQNPAVGMVAPKTFDPLESRINWGSNFDCARRLLQEAGEQLHADQPLEFPAGSMFWFKTKALAKLLSLRLEIRHFEPENGQIDGTLAHAIERSLFHFVEAAGFTWLLVAKDPEGTRSLDWFHGLPPARVRALNRLMVRAEEKDVVSRHYPECTGFACIGSEVTRPRLNLLVPTADQSRAYAGVATALDVFAALRAALGNGYDARIICTDVSPSDQYAPPPHFVTQPPDAPDPGAQDIVVDAARRYKFPFQVRQDDVFLATAWWTARSAFAINDWQRSFYGRSPARILYLIQDFECGFYPWSTKYGLADATYRRPDQTIPIFNTDILRDFFKANGYYDAGYALEPAINATFAAAIERGAAKKRNVLLYARPHAERNCLPFLDMLVARLVETDAETWRNWRFLAIGETFEPSTLRCSDRIEVLGRLSLGEYARLASESALAVSLMVSPHPSYPPLELAAAGVRVLANRYGDRDPATLHDNIRSFGNLDVAAAASHLAIMARDWAKDPAAGWSGTPKVSWFFDGKTNLGTLAQSLAREIAELRSGA